MSEAICPECACSIQLSSWFLSGQRVTFHVLPWQEAPFRQACRHPDQRPDTGMFACPSMGAVLQGRLSNRSKPPIQSPLQAPPQPAAGDDAAPGGRPAPGEPPRRAPVLAFDAAEPFRLLGDQWDGNPILQWPGVDSGGLLRLLTASVPATERLAHLIRALTARFDGLGDVNSVVCEPQGTGLRRPLMIRERRWKLLYHSGQAEGDVDPAALRLAHAAALQARRDQLLQDLQSSARIFIWRSTAPAAEADIRQVIAGLRHFAPHLCAWVVAPDADRLPGMVEYAMGGLLKVYAPAPRGTATPAGEDAWSALRGTVTAMAGYLRHRSEWGASGAADGPDLSSKDMFLEEVAASIDWDERKSDRMAAGPVQLGESFVNRSDKGQFEEEPICQNMRGALIHNVVLDSVYAMLLRDGRKVEPTRYMVAGSEYNLVGVKLQGLRSMFTDKVAIIGFNRLYENYYHWMSQCLPAIDLSVRRAGREQSVLVLPPLVPWQEETLAMLDVAGLPRFPVDIKNEMDCYLLRAYYSEFLAGQAAFSLSHRVTEVFDRMAATVEPDDDGPSLIYVGRTDAIHRPISNEAEVQALLAQFGFVSIVPGAMSIREQIRVFRRARVVVGPHGAGMTNIGFCRPGTKVLELVQSSYLNHCMARIAQSRGLAYHVACFDSVVPPGATLHMQPWSVDINVLLTALRGVVAA